MCGSYGPDFGVVSVLGGCGQLGGARDFVTQMAARLKRSFYQATVNQAVEAT
jgi:hypothetical protein